MRQKLQQIVVFWRITRQLMQTRPSNCSTTGVDGRLYIMLALGRNIFSYFVRKEAREYGMLYGYSKYDVCLFVCLLVTQQEQLLWVDNLPLLYQPVSVISDDGYIFFVRHKAQQKVQCMAHLAKVSEHLVSEVFVLIAFFVFICFHAIVSKNHVFTRNSSYCCSAS